MDRRQQWRKVLETEKQRWSALPHDQLVSRLSTTVVYEVEQGSQTYQIEIEVLQNTTEYAHVAISVDDGSIPRSFFPMTDSFITKRPNSN